MLGLDEFLTPAKLAHSARDLLIEVLAHVFPCLHFSEVEADDELPHTKLCHARACLLSQRLRKYFADMTRDQREKGPEGAMLVKARPRKPKTATDSDTALDASHPQVTFLILGQEC